MASSLEQLQQVTGADVAELLRARERTAERIARRRELLSALAVDDDATVVLMGSWGRRELTPRSDDDYMVLVRGAKRSAPPRPLPEAVGRAFAADPSGSSSPGREGIFAKVVYSADLVQRIGLDDDSNTNLTRRMLLMLESVAACNPAVLEGTRRDVIEDYLSDSVKEFRPPRFLLNDLVRYWRTIGVDFVAKDRQRAGEGWGLRNAKLRTSRKLLFASGLLPVLRCHELTAGQIPDFLAAQFALPPADRVAAAFLHYEALIPGAAVFGAYDRFLRLIGDEQVRAELHAIDGREAADASERFAEVTQLGHAIDRGLISLLFGDGLRRTTQDYAIF
ncbi:hypothetical protein VSS74_15165 [Conexibacter stalactiti]|uniref:Protein-PII uridylyltransferase N-terminal domain-containing protein n=1 Tax=Conexibacter stalactiti TaxID=1940611 RepID=A0ABU4HQT4_9ACTN|nr:hypothetical protein [Conexibacter stalactiti]MDW5595688.1 hypothetical protein [Conexibacter stalactiti]MEC5036330.1 hypothetical protein [Conexibacter stalactiti]